MSAAALDATQPMTTAEFLKFNERENTRGDNPGWEFDGFEPQAKAADPVGHYLVLDSIRRLISAQLPDGGEVFSQSVFLRLPAGSEGDQPMRGPDVMLTCKPVRGEDTDVKSAVIVVEVLTSDSERTDRVVKLAEYARLADIECYLIVDWKLRTIDIYRRDGDRLLHDVEAGSAAKTLELNHGIRIDRNAIFAELDSRA